MTQHLLDSMFLKAHWH